MEVWGFIGGFHLFDGVLERLSFVAEPHTNHLPLVVEAV